MPGKHAAMMKIAVGSAAAALLGLFLAMPAPGVLAAASDVRLGTVGCATSPEVVEVKNFGSDPQDLTGWQLLSDGNNPFVLTSAGSIPGGGSIFIESGPTAQATFRWSPSEVFRDNDATDYVRLVDSSGATRGQTACAQAAATATPTPTPAAGGVPNGGGRPAAVPDSALSPAMLIYAGGSVIGAVVGITVTWLSVSFGLDRRRKRRQHAATATDTAVLDAPAEPDQEPAQTPAPVRARHGRRTKAPAQPLLLALVVALAAAILVALLMQAQDSAGRR